MQQGADLERVVDTCAELAAVGDGGFWCERIITPLFLLLVQEVSAVRGELHVWRECGECGETWSCWFRR